MPTAVTSVRCEYAPDARVPVPSPRVSWITASDVPGWRQSGAQLRWVSGGQSVTADVSGDTSVFLDWPFEPLTARQEGSLEVRVEGPDGWSAWSEPTSVMAAFLADGEWVAAFIGLPAPEVPAQPVLLRHGFEVRPDLRRATLYATAQGTYQAEINGTPVDDQLLKPGWTPYQFRLVHETTDVTGLLTPGLNVLGVALTGGWFTEKYGFQGLEQPFYGTQPSFAGQLLLEYADGGSEWVVSGGDWQATAQGPWVSAGIYGGERYDARRVIAGWSRPGRLTGWVDAAVVPSGPTPGPACGPAVRVTGAAPVAQVLTSPSGGTILDFGQNLVGRLRIAVQGPAGTTITLRHAEVLDEGELGLRPLRKADALDTYTLSGDGVEVWAPSFTFHGFRYAQVSGWPGVLDPGAVTAEVIGSDMERTGWLSVPTRW